MKAVDIDPNFKGYKYDANPWRDQLKGLCKTNGVHLKDVAVLGVNRDPFLCGSPQQIKMAEWFSNIIDTYYPSTKGLHLRRVHYFISQKADMVDVNGTGHYRNTYEHWVKLSMTSLIARYLGYVDCNIFIDRRNPESDVFSYYYPHTTIEDGCKELPDKIVKDINMHIWNAHLVQPYHIEIWVEKSTMNDILMPLCRQLGFVLVRGLGELSLTKVNPELFNRVRKAERPCRIFYISDFDPAGNRMPKSIARKIEWYNKQFELDIKLKHIILTEEQVKEYNLPKAPIKAKTQHATDIYKRKFEERFGEGAVELDALESLHAGEFESIVRSHVLKYFDVEKHNAIVRENGTITNFIRSSVAEHLKTLKLPPYESKFKFLESDLSVDESDDETWLYDSTLKYNDQLDRYKELYGEFETEDSGD